MASGCLLLLKWLRSSPPGSGGRVGNDQDEETDVELSASDQQRPFDISLHDPPATPGFVVRGVYDAQDVLGGNKKRRTRGKGSGGRGWPSAQRLAELAIVRFLHRLDGRSYIRRQAIVSARSS